MLGYMVTWNTYGTWLQGDKRGWTKNGKIYRGKAALFESNRQSLKSKPVRLNKIQQEIVRNEINLTANRFGQEVLELSVCSSHVHLVVNEIEKPVGIVVGGYKRDATYALKKTGLTSKVWADGSDKRFCYDEKSLLDRIEYVKRHTDQ